MNVTADKKSAYRKWLKRNHGGLSFNINNNDAQWPNNFLGDHYIWWRDGRKVDEPPINRDSILTASGAKKRQKIYSTTNTITDVQNSPRRHETWERENRDPACSVLKKLQAEINGRIAKATILDERSIILKNEIDDNNIELLDRQMQMQEQQKRVAIIPSIFDKILLTVFHPGSSIITKCKGVNRTGCLYGNCITIFLGTAVITAKGVKTVSCSACSEYATDTLDQMMQYDVSPDRAFRYLVRNGNCVVGTCDVCDDVDILPSSNWERAHDFAQSKGGDMSAYNIFCAHARCNDKQKALHIDTYRAKLGLQPVRRSL